MENVTITPSIQKHRVNSAGLCSVTLSVYLNRKVVAYDKLHKKIKPADWDEKKRQSKTDHQLNALIRKRVGDLDREFTRRQLMGEPLTKELIKKIVKGNEYGGSFYEFAKEIIQTKRLKDGQPYDEDTKRRYNDEIVRLQAYRPDLLFSQLSIDFIHKYKEWMQNDYIKKDGTKLHKNSVWKALSVLRTFCNDAIKEGLLLKENYPFKDFTIPKAETDPAKIKFLELDQVEAIEKVLTEKAHLLEDMTVKVGWRFLAMCVLGIRISDAMRLNAAFLNDAGNLDFTPHKTRRFGNQAQIPIVSERQERYLGKTLALPLPNVAAKSFRTVFNAHLKIISAMAGTHHITSHSGRHTMGSFMVDANIGDAAAKAMLGVKSNNTMKVYSHLKQSKLISEAGKLKGVF